MYHIKYPIFQASKQFHFQAENENTFDLSFGSQSDNMRSFDSKSDESIFKIAPLISNNAITIVLFIDSNKNSQFKYNLPKLYSE